MTATYLRKGQGKSDRAYEAEANGTYPLTTAIRAISWAIQPYYKIPQRIIRKWLKDIGPSEWHHVGKYAAECDYYDTEPILTVLLVDCMDGRGTNIRNEPVFFNVFLDCYEK